MVDVLVIRWLLLYAAAVKVFDGVVEGLWLSAAMWLAAVVVVARSERAGFAAVAAAAFGMILLDYTDSGHVATIAWFALAAAMFDGRDRWVALRALTVVIYLFAGLNKLLFGFLDGEMIATQGGGTIDMVPVDPAVLAAGATIAELWLAWAVWRRSRLAMPGAVGLHAGILFWSGPTTVDDILVASLFQIMLVSLVWISTRSGRGDVGGEPCLREDRGVDWGLVDGAVERQRAARTS